MKSISSAHNRAIKENKKLRMKKYRDSTREYLIEGIRLTEEALKAEKIKEVFYDESLELSERGRQLLRQLELYETAKGLECCCKVESPVMRELAETKTPQGVVAVVKKKGAGLSVLEQITKRRLLLIVDGISDPGNLGTLIRTSWAAGVAAVICLPETVDPWNGKCVRSTMGGIFHVPLITGVNWPEVREWCRSHAYQLVACDLEGELEYHSGTYEDKVAVIVGSEGEGLKTVIPETVDKRVRIPLLQGAESLNAAVAGSIVIYEILRQGGSC